MTSTNKTTKSTENYFTPVNQILKGIGQIMLQENVLTGLLFLIGIFYNSLNMGIAAVVATACGTATARLLKFNKTGINQGLYGFSAALVGVAVLAFLRPVFPVWLLVIAGSVAAALIQHFFIRRNIPVFTLPFVLVSWGIFLLAKYQLPEILADVPALSDATVHRFDFALKGFGQVIFQNSTISGIIFFIAVFINSPVAALYGLAAAILSALVSFQLSFPVDEINNGLFGFNAVLCAIVFAGRQPKDGIWALMAVLLSLAVSYLLLHYNVVQLTFPFVAASCITVYFRSGFRMVPKK